MLTQNKLIQLHKYKHPLCPYLVQALHDGLQPTADMEGLIALVHNACKNSPEIKGEKIAYNIEMKYI